MDEKDKEFNCSSYGYVINLDGQGNIGGCQRQIPQVLLMGIYSWKKTHITIFRCKLLERELTKRFFRILTVPIVLDGIIQRKAWGKGSRVTSETRYRYWTLQLCCCSMKKVDQTIECLISFIPSGKKIYILNNGSSKESISELKEFCKNYPQIKYLIPREILV